MPIVSRYATGLRHSVALEFRDAELSEVSSARVAQATPPAKARTCDCSFCLCEAIHLDPFGSNQHPSGKNDAILSAREEQRKLERISANLIFFGGHRP